jgi:hypothetical protein
MAVEGIISLAPNTFISIALATPGVYDGVTVGGVADTVTVLSSNISFWQ